MYYVSLFFYLFLAFSSAAILTIVARAATSGQHLEPDDRPAIAGTLLLALVTLAGSIAHLVHLNL